MKTERKGRVLVVDDELIFRALLEESLDEYHVATAATGSQALAALELLRPDVILLDVELPGLNGYDLCRAIRNLPQCRFTKIAFVSSHAELSKRLEGYAAGGDDYISKPFNADEVAAKVRVLMRLKAVEEVDQLKKASLSLISHETMTPLTIIRGYCDLLLDDAEPSAEATKEGLLAISGAADWLTGLLSKTMLSCSLQETESVSLHPLPLQAIVAEACGSKTALASGTGINFQVQLEPATVFANAQMLGKAFSFILDNSVRVSPAGSVIELTGAGEGKRYRLEIQDRGPGISEEFLARVFEPFAVQDIQHHKHGSGLSMFLARRIAELHHGTLELANVAGGGCVATFWLPLADNTEI